MSLGRTAACRAVGGGGLLGGGEVPPEGLDLFADCERAFLEPQQAARIGSVAVPFINCNAGARVGAAVHQRDLVDFEVAQLAHLRPRRHDAGSTQPELK